MKKTFSIQHMTGQQTLFEGLFPSFKACAETAVREGVSLQKADFRFKNLSGASLDEGVFTGADFTGANLGGANLSEADLQECSFQRVNLTDACLAQSDLRYCDFHSARFGATDIAGARLEGSLFSGLPCFSLDFVQAQSMEGCVYVHQNTKFLNMGRPPVVILGALHTPVILLEKNMILSDKVLPRTPNGLPGPLLKALTAAADLPNFIDIKQNLA